MADISSKLTQSDSMNPLYDITKPKETGFEGNETEISNEAEVMMSQNGNRRKEKDNLNLGKQNVDTQLVAEKVDLGLPRVNCPERIIICLDNSHEMEKATFQSRTGDTYSPKQLIKRAIGIFLHSKHRIDKRHEFALVLLKESAYWISEFTSDPEKIITLINSCTDSFQSETCDLSTFFNAVHQHAPLAQVVDPEFATPAYIVRAIMLYGRSHCIPTFNSTQSLKMLYTSPYFFLDVYYIHEPVSESNNCEEIFDRLCELDEKGSSYVYEVSRNPTKLYDCMAQLLAHPLQRPLQRDIANSIKKVTDELGST